MTKTDSKNIISDKSLVERIRAIRLVAFYSITSLPIVVQNTHPEVIHRACYQTRAPGGYGAVREICDLFEHTLTSGKE